MGLMKSGNIVQFRQPQQQQIVQEDEEKEEGRFHILAVDDSVIDRKLLEKLLKAFSCQVTCLESGEKALEYLGLLHNSTAAASSPQQHQGLKVNLIMTDFSCQERAGMIYPNASRST
ncbi:Two-component response regulator ARR9 [Hibiscus syriacus]|uniref:Two-component response regulator ARR9 n=1 Tax=Hibiscus syriacus TaxID=106335 RepID=A0A6A3CF53_HIBSY|nr:Two-component response regulator ARR9 [Hibiscus syriacus]